MADNFLLPVPGVVGDLAQKGLLDRAFWEALFPALMYREEASFEEWPANTGTELFMTRQGLLAPATRPLKPGEDPTPKVLSYEQFSVTLDQYGDALDTYMPNASVQVQNTFISNIKALGLQAGQTVNRLPRNALFKSYLSGHTVLTTAAANTDTTLQVASLNGFLDVVILGKNVRPQQVSPQYPLQVTLVNGATSIIRNVVGYQPNDPNVPFGPGVLQLSAAVGGSGLPARAAVLSSARPQLMYSGGGSSIDSVSVGDILSLQDIINASALLRDQNIQPHDDGWFHAHIGALANAQVFADPVFQRLTQSLPDGMRMQSGWLGTMSGVAFWLNNESPNANNSGDLTQTGTNAYYADDIGGEVINENGVSIGNVVITGKGALFERGLDESAFLTEAGVNGKIGEFSVVNNAIAVDTERVRLVIRAPQDRLAQKVGAAWSISTGFCTPTDITAQSGSTRAGMRYRRAIVLRHAQGNISA